MNSWWQAVAAVAGGLVVVWILLIAVLWWQGRKHADPVGRRDALRLVPDVVRLLRRLASDRTLPRGVRVRIVLLGVYLASPVDLVPDVIPVIGYADDVVIVAWVLRSVVRRAGPEALDRHWAGTEEGLAAVKRLAGVRPTVET
ncbi:MAG: YkvA family protein [Aeromicrobium sp.]